MVNSAAFTSTDQWKSGANVADFLDAHFSAQGWNISPTTPHEERTLCLGDRHFRRGDEHRFVEYKSGIQSHFTGNIFLETISVDTENKLGWVLTCRANYIMYAALLDQKILVFVPSFLRSCLADLRLEFRTTKTAHGQNKSYNTLGLLVPMTYAEKYLAKQVILLPSR